ncbi:MAG: hypothetical protein WCO99_13470, partial [Planctomycetota bacterium]
MNMRVLAILLAIGVIGVVLLAPRSGARSEPPAAAKPAAAAAAATAATAAASKTTPSAPAGGTATATATATAAADIPARPEQIVFAPLAFE